MTAQQPTTKLHTNYPPMPEPKHSRVVDGLLCITIYEHQNLMRAYVDADRAMRAQVAPAAQGDALSWLQANDMAALERFAETTDDDESYDIGKDAVQRLVGFGCLRSHGFGKYSITDFGHYVLNDWSLARELPFKSQSEREWHFLHDEEGNHPDHSDSPTASASRRETAMNKILVNAWKCPDGTILESRHRYDFVSYTDAEGRNYFVDGGRDYQRISGEGMEFVGCYDTDPHEKIREVLSWGSYGKDGKQEKRYILLKCLTDEHIDAILRTQSHIRDTPIEKVLKDEQEYRKVNKIVVKDGL